VNPARVVAFLVCTSLFAACSDDELIASPATRMHEPFGLRASEDLVQHVRLEWSVPPESLPHSLRVERDGVEIARLAAGVKTYLDNTAARGEAEVPPPTLHTDPARVELRWSTPAVRAGTRHSYRIAADYGWGVLRRSSPAIGGRGAPSVGAYRIDRDGEPLATLPNEIRSFLDEEAIPGSAHAAELEPLPGVLSILLRWEPARTTPGASATYAVTALTEVGAFTSERVKGGMTAPEVEGYRILRDGEEIAALPPSATSFEDQSAQAGSLDPIPAPSATRHLDSLELNWEEPLSRPGRLHRYVLETRYPSQTLRSEVHRVRRDAPTPLDYHVVRDGTDFNVEEVTRFVYRDGAPGALGAPLDVIASEGSEGGSIALRWSAPREVEGTTNEWAVRIHSELGVSDPSPGVAAGRKPPELLRYEIRRAGGAWLQVGLESSFEDPDAPEGPVVVLAAPRVDPVLGAVELDLATPPATAPGQETSYEVRAVTAEGPTAISSPATGFRGPRQVSGLSYQWERSTRDEDGRYRDLLGATGEAAVDAGAPLDEGRYYRVRFRGDEIDGVSSGVRVMPLSYLSVSAGGAHSCGVRSDGSAWCWGSDPDGRASPPEELIFLEVSAGGRHSCGLLVDGGIRCWGDDGEGQSSPPDAGPFTAVFAGEGHSCAVRRKGERICWGSAEQVDVSQGRGCEIRVDGSLRCWGEEVADPPDGRFVDVSVGAGHACGLREDGKVDCWGRNTEGQAPRQP